MATTFISLPQVGPVDPTKVINANYEYLQAATSTIDDISKMIYRDTLVDNGIYLYEAKFVGVESGANFATFKRTFTVYKDNTGAAVLDVSSDYTKKMDLNWAVSVTAFEDDVVLYVKGDINQSVTWVVTITKTMHRI